MTWFGRLRLDSSAADADYFISKTGDRLCPGSSGLSNGSEVDLIGGIGELCRSTHRIDRLFDLTEVVVGELPSWVVPSSRKRPMRLGKS